MSLSRWERKQLLPYGAVTAIAQKLGRSKGHVSQVISGHRRDRRVEVAVARIIKLPVDRVFPARVSGSDLVGLEPVEKAS
jgi:hypothetical protein